MILWWLKTFFKTNYSDCHRIKIQHHYMVMFIFLLWRRLVSVPSHVGRQSLIYSIVKLGYSELNRTSKIWSLYPGKCAIKLLELTNKHVIHFVSYNQVRYSRVSMFYLGLFVLPMFSPRMLRTSGSFNNSIFWLNLTISQTRFVFRIGFADNEVDRTLEDGIKSMYLSEKSQLTLRIKLSPKKNNLTCLSGLEDVWITFSCVVTLATLENVDPIFKWTPTQKLESSRELKAQGVELFTQKRYLDAFWAFRQSLTLAW